MIRYLALDDVMAAYARKIGTPVVRDEAALLSAIGRPQASAFGVDAYPTLALKAAALMHSLAQNLREALRSTQRKNACSRSV